MERKDNLSSKVALEGFYAIPALHAFSLILACKMSVKIVSAYRTRDEERARQWSQDGELF